MSSSVHVHNKWEDIVILGEVSTQGLYDTTLTVEAKYPISFRQSGKTFALSLHYNGSNSFLFVNARKVYQFKAKNLEIKYHALCLRNISEDFTINNLKKIGLKDVIIFLVVVDFNPIDTYNVLDVHKYLMRGTWFKNKVWRKYFLDY